MIHTDILGADVTLSTDAAPPVDISRNRIISLCEQHGFAYVLRTAHDEWQRRGMTDGAAVKVLKEGTPILLHGECIACHTTVETDTREARKFQVTVRETGMPKVHFEVTCPTCGTPFGVIYRGPGCPDRVNS